MALFKTTELLPWPWEALSGYWHRGLPLGCLKNFITVVSFLRYSELFCWWLYSVFSFRVWVPLLHRGIGSANAQACFYSDSKVLLTTTQGLSNSSCWVSVASSTPTPPTPNPYLLAPAASSAREQEMWEAQKDKYPSPWTRRAAK